MMMEIEKYIRYAPLAVGLKPSAIQGEARLRGLYWIIYESTAKRVRGAVLSVVNYESSAKSRNFTNPMPGVEAAGGPGIAMAAPESP